VTYQRDLGVNLAGVEMILRLRDQLVEVHRRLGGLADDLRAAMEPDESSAGTDIDE
jgi:MerR family transcriptional regulator, heat shock protein HspR